MIKPKKILIIQLRRIGDVIMTTPVIEVLRNNFPEAHIDFLVEKQGAEILANNPYLTTIHTYDSSRPLQWISKIRSLQYDWVLDFLCNPRSAVITALSKAPVRAGFSYGMRKWAYNYRVPVPRKRQSIIKNKLELLEHFNVKLTHHGSAMFLADEEKKYADEFLKKNIVFQGRPIIGIAPGSRRLTRQWPAEYYARLCDTLMSVHNYNILLLWGPGDEGVVEKIRQSMKDDPIIPPLLSLRHLGAVTSRCATVIANSNGPMHIAEALHVPTLTIYGPNDPVSWKAGNVDHAFMRAEEVSCIGCSKNVCDNDLACMHAITPDMVEQECKKLAERVSPAMVST